MKDKLDIESQEAQVEACCKPGTKPSQGCQQALKLSRVDLLSTLHALRDGLVACLTEGHKEADPPSELVAFPGALNQDVHARPNGAQFSGQLLCKLEVLEVARVDRGQRGRAKLKQGRLARDGLSRLQENSSLGL